MADTRTYEDFAGMLGRRVARVKEACGGAVGKKQPGGILGYPLSLISGAKKMSESWNNPSVAMKKNGERKARRGFLGFNEDEYGDAAGRYGFFSGYKDPNGLRQDAFFAMKNADENERMYQSTGIEEYRNRAERYRAKAEELEGMADDRERGNKQRITDYETETGNQVAKKRKGGNIGNIMNYTVYFKDGGLLPRSQRRVYQTGGKASAQDTMQQLYQLTQVAMNGSGQEQQQAMQALGQFVGEAMNGNQQYAQIIQAVFDGAKKGSREMTQMAQVFQSIMQQMQKREFGGRLDYITMLRNGGRPRYQKGGVEYDDKGTKVKRGFFGRNEDRYGDMAGRYGFFSQYESPDHIRKRSQSYLDRMEKHRDPRNVFKGIYTPEEQRIIDMVERNMAKADEIEEVNKKRGFQYQRKPDFIQREEP